MPEDPTNAERQPMEPPSSISPDELLRQLADAAPLILPMPPGPRPGQACLYKGGEVFYVDPAFLDRLESGSPISTKEVGKVNHDLIALASDCIKMRSPYRFDAC
jgi:hypothetical protein